MNKYFISKQNSTVLGPNTCIDTDLFLPYDVTYHMTIHCMEFYFFILIDILFFICPVGHIKVRHKAVYLLLVFNFGF